MSPSCDKHMEWLENVFGAHHVKIFRTKDKTKVMHVTMAVNDGILYLADSSCNRETPVSKVKIEDTHGFWYHVMLEDPVALWKKAMAKSFTVLFDLQYYGAELSCFRDPFGFNWGVAKAGECRKPEVIPCFFLPDGQCDKHVKWKEKAVGAKRIGIYRSDDDLVQHCVLEVNGTSIYTSDDTVMPGAVEAREAIAEEIKQFFCLLELKDPHSLWDQTLKEGA